MANTKEVRKQISSIKNTQKITSAMEMVAASKIRKTQDVMLLGRPYSEKIKDVISHIALIQALNTLILFLKKESSSSLRRKI